MRQVHRTHYKEMLTIPRSRRLMAVLLAASMVLSGCVPIPWKSDQPRFSEQELKTFTLGVSTREDVQAALGKPDLTRRDNRLWIYGWEQHHGKLAGVTIVGNPPLVGPVPVWLPLYSSYHVLFITFDATGALRGIDLKGGEMDWKYGSESCRQDGVCARDWKYFAGSARLDDSVTIITASHREDDHAKHFVPGITTCGVYLYTEDYRVLFTFANLKDKPLDDETYVLCKLDPGVKSLQASSGYSINHDRQYKFECPKGENIYISLQSNPYGIMSLEKQNLGKKMIANRRLQLLDCNE
jgi:hypothetical protein